MYLEFFNLKEFPFSIACDEKYFFESDIHSEALSNMLYAVTQRKGMVLISGCVGAGKTFLGSMLASRLGLGSLVVAVRHPPGSGKQLLRAVGAGLGLDLPPDTDIMAAADAVREALENQQKRGRLVAVLIDEIQDLPDEALEEVRLIWNWEADGQRLAQLILVGQPEIRKRLLQPKWESLRQRIVLSYHLGRLSAPETAHYIHHRIRIAAGEPDDAQDGADDGQAEPDGLPRFTPDAVDAIHRATDGTPRLINSLCDNALLTAYARGEHEISAGIIDSVLSSMTFWAVDPNDDGETPAAQPIRQQAPAAPESQVADSKSQTSAAAEQPAAAEAAAATADDSRQLDEPVDAGNWPGTPPADDNSAANAQSDPPAGDSDATAQSEFANPESRIPDDPPELTPVDPTAPAIPDGASVQPPADAAPPDVPDGNGHDADLLRAALLGEPTPQMARKIYRTAPPDSEAQHIAIRILAQDLVRTLRAVNAGELPGDR